jgi:hypothetical protein
MNALINQWPAIALLVFLSVLVWRNKRANRESLGSVRETFDDAADPSPLSKPTENSALLDALVYYFAQSATARAALNALCCEFPNETVEYDQLATAVVSDFERRRRQPPPRSTINKIAQLLQGARLIEMRNNGFRATELGKQLANVVREGN